MSEVVNLRKNITSFSKSERFAGYSKVVINVTDDLSYTAGDDTGRTLTLSCPWGTQAMANDLLQQMRGFSYQPYTAEGAILDPASELGDGINVNGAYSGIYKMDINFNSHCAADVSAPSDEEIDHDYQYESKQNREIKRKNKQFASQLSIQQDKITAEVEERKSDIKTVKSTLEVQSSQIVAKVNKNEGSSSTFGWALETDSWRIFAGSSTVLKATKDGLEVKGKITATSGTIGGFTINSNSISYNNQEWGGTNTTGIYIGPNGIQLGNSFKVDSAGNLTAASGTFTGSVNAGSIRYGGEYGTLSGNSLSSRSVGGSVISYSTLTPANMIAGINTSLSYADFSNGVFGGWNTAPYLYVNSLHVNSYMYFQGYRITTKTLSFTDGDGNKQAITYLGWQR